VVRGSRREDEDQSAGHPPVLPRGALLDLPPSVPEDGDGTHEAGREAGGAEAGGARGTACRRGAEVRAGSPIPAPDREERASEDQEDRDVRSRHGIGNSVLRV